MKQKQIAQQILDLDKRLKEHPYDLTARSLRNDLVNELCSLILGKSR